ncbi:MAG: EAL domain-containing protein, partial [Cyanobacteria bacterium P01_F01_bin.3]
MDCLHASYLAEVATRYNLPVIFWECDRDGRFITALGERLYEMVPHILSTSCWELHQNDPEIYKLYETVFAGEEVPYTVPYLGRTWSCVMVPSSGGGCLGIGIERTLELSLADRWSKIVQASPFAIATIAPDGLMLECSPAWERLLGFNPTGYHHQDFTHPEDLEFDTAKHQALIDGAIESYSMVKRYVTDKGYWVTVLLEVGILRSTGTAIAFVTDMSENEAQRHRELMRADVMQGVLQSEFELWYQPIVQIKDAETVGVEALIRWRKSDDDVRSPAQFLFDLEPQTIGLLSLQVVEMAIADIPDLAPYWIAINLDPRTLEDEIFSSKLLEIIDDVQVSPESLQFEVTEQYLMEIDLVSGILGAIAERGIKIKVDDLGSKEGYSNLQKLTLPFFKGIKIDKCLTDELFHEAKGEATQRLFRTLL